MRGAAPFAWRDRFHCRGYRQTGSEGNAYVFYAGRIELCRMNDYFAWRPPHTVRISGFGCELFSDFDFEAALHVGSERRAMYEDGVREAFRIQLTNLDPIQFAIFLPCNFKEDRISVKPVAGGYDFFSEARKIARLRIRLGHSSRPRRCPITKALRRRFASPRLPDRPGDCPVDDDYRVDVRLDAPVSAELALAIFAFPELRFAYEEQIAVPDEASDAYRMGCSDRVAGARRGPHHPSE